MNRVVLIALVLASSVAFIPVFGHFWAEWSRRKGPGERNPLSLTICGHVIVSMYLGPVLLWSVGVARDDMVTGVVAALNFVVAITYLFSIPLTRKKFADRDPRERNSP